MLNTNRSIARLLLNGNMSHDGRSVASAFRRNSPRGGGLKANHAEAAEARSTQSYHPWASRRHATTAWSRRRASRGGSGETIRANERRSISEGVRSSGSPPHSGGRPKAAASRPRQTRRDGARNATTNV